MYLYKLLIFFLFCSGLKVNGQFSPLEVTGSGDGLNENSTYSRLPLIDDNGEISTAVTGVDAVKNLEETVDNFTDTTLFHTDITAEETTVKFLGNDNFTDTTMTQNSQTTIFTTALPTTDKEATDTQVDSTTTSPLMTSSTTETTTTADTTTTEEESTTTESITTSTTVKTTKKPIKTDTATETPEVEQKTKLDTTAVKLPPTSAPSSTVSMAEDAGKRCLFMDTGLTCDVEVICYGDGEIDCTDDEEMDADETDFFDELPPSVDASDYISEGDMSETVPWGGTENNANRLNLFKMFSLIPTNNDRNLMQNTDVTSETNMSTTSMPSFNLTMPANEELLAEENAQMDDTTNVYDAETAQDSEYMSGLDGFLTPTEFTVPMKIHDVKISTSTDNSSNTDFTEDFHDMILESDEMMSTNSPNASEIQIPSTFNETIIYEEVINNETWTEVTATNSYSTTSDALDKILLENVTEKDQDVIARAKRDNSANSSNGYYISNYKVSELESSKKKLKVKSCKLSGNLLCIPRPTKSSCSGKTLCQVPPQAIETVEKPTTQKGLEKWTIAVIVICAITATFTIALLIYLVFTSYKKLKVQPQNGVTTLNYINSTQP